MAFQKIGSLLTKSLKRLGIQKEAEAALVLKYSQEVIDEYFKGALTNKVRPRSFKEGNLTFEVTNPVFGSEIQNNSFGIINRINHKLNSNKVRRLRIKIKTGRG